ncbi:hypothetical protein AAG906_026023 [Vitis piasezkii]
MRGSACVEVMTTLHGSAPSLRRRAEDPPIRTSSLHVGASEGLQSLFSYSSDPGFPLFSLQLRVHCDQDEFEYGRTVRLCLGCICPFQFRLSFLSYYSYVVSSFRSSSCQDQISLTVWTHLLGLESRED